MEGAACVGASLPARPFHCPRTGALESVQLLSPREPVQLGEERLEVLGAGDAEILRGGSFENPGRVGGLDVTLLPVLHEEAFHHPLGGLIVVLGFRRLAPGLFDLLVRLQPLPKRLRGTQQEHLKVVLEAVDTVVGSRHVG